MKLKVRDIHAMQEFDGMNSVCIIFTFEAECANTSCLKAASSYPFNIGLECYEVLVLETINLIGHGASWYQYQLERS